MYFSSRILKYHWVNRACSLYTWGKKLRKRYGLIDSVAQSTLTKHIALYNSNQYYYHDIINYAVIASCTLENQKGDTKVI